MSTPFPNVCDLRCVFQAAGETWVNTYEVLDLTGSGLYPGPGHSIVTHLITFAENNLSDAATLVEIKEYIHRLGSGHLPIADEPPLWVLPVNAGGQRDAAYGTAGNTDYMDIQQVALCRKLNNGRVGKLFMRCLLREGDVNVAGVGDRWQFNGGAGTVNPTSFAAQVTGNLASFLTAGASTDFKFCVPHYRKSDGSHSVNTVDTFTLAYPGWHRRKH